MFGSDVSRLLFQDSDSKGWVVWVSMEKDTWIVSTYDGIFIEVHQDVVSLKSF